MALGGTNLGVGRDQMVEQDELVGGGSCGEPPARPRKARTGEARRRYGIGEPDAGIEGADTCRAAAASQSAVALSLSLSSIMGASSSCSAVGRGCPLAVDWARRLSMMSTFTMEAVASATPGWRVQICPDEMFSTAALTVPWRLSTYEVADAPRGEPVPDG